jgi:hypothetical protein
MRATRFFVERALLAKSWIRHQSRKIFREQGSLLQVARMAASYNESISLRIGPSTDSINWSSPGM